ncbi:hypothetical protein Nepgr_010098 [Nepenthes gracilis]|uniref:Uncharacterized protein n=1 Tax=Nepenthes gracilis TaxID=150966 RepID=A0AAD3SBS1_NEPGR|nr:hypothetical protein Nepgr_010098 [Nepenthes gracilis]
MVVAQFLNSMVSISSAHSSSLKRRSNSLSYFFHRTIVSMVPPYVTSFLVYGLRLKFWVNINSWTPLL